MTCKEKINTWRDRIREAGYTQKTFAVYAGIHGALLNHYIMGKKEPGIARFDLIEGKLRDLGV